jgi:hypothetical protein
LAASAGALAPSNAKRADAQKVAIALMQSTPLLPSILPVAHASSTKG